MARVGEKGNSEWGVSNRLLLLLLSLVAVSFESREAFSLVCTSCVFHLINLLKRQDENSPYSVESY